MKSCVRCGSFAINEKLHGREIGVDVDLCDVCYWRKKAELLGADCNEMVEEILDNACDLMSCEHPKTHKPVLCTDGYSSRVGTLKLLEKYGKIRMLPDGYGRVQYGELT